MASFAAYGSGAAAAASTDTPAAPSGARRGALIEREVDYGQQRMSSDADWRRGVVQQMAAAGWAIEKAMGGVPQDIEGGVVVAGDSVTLHVFQTRPQ